MFNKFKEKKISIGEHIYDRYDCAFWGCDNLIEIKMTKQQKNRLTTLAYQKSVKSLRTRKNKRLAVDLFDG